MKSAQIIIATIAVLIISSCKFSKQLNKNTMDSTNKNIQVAGNKFQVDFGGDFVFELDFHSTTKMTWVHLNPELSLVQISNGGH